MDALFAEIPNSDIAFGDYIAEQEMLSEQEASEYLDIYNVSY